MRAEAWRHAMRSMKNGADTRVAPPGVVFLLFQVPTCGDEWLPEMPFAACAAELRAQGHRADVAHILLDAANPDLWRATENDLIAALAAAATCVVVFDQLPTAQIARRLRDEVGAVLVDADPWGGARDVTPDYAIRHLNTARYFLTQLCGRLLTGRPVGELANVVTRQDGVAQRCCTADVVVQPCPAQDYVVRADRWFFPHDYRPIAKQRALQTSTGCPYVSTDLSLTRAGAAPAGHSGCAFCTLGGHYEALSNAESVATLATEIATIRRLEPEVELIFLSDQLPIRYLVALVNQLIAQQSLPIGLLFSTRADWLVQAAPAVEQAVATMAAAGGTLGFYLAGLETFSPRLAAIYGKSRRPERWPSICEQAVGLLQQLQRNYLGHFVLHHGATSFIVHSPWTTLKDLQCDADAIDRLGLGALAAEAPFSRLRLYAGTALARKAEAEGLIETRAAAMTESGYAPMIPWRFADRSAQRVCTLLDALRPAVSPHFYPSLFRAIVNLVRHEAKGQSTPMWPDELRAQLQFLLETAQAIGSALCADLQCEVGLACNNGCRGCTNRHRRAPARTTAEGVAAQVLDCGAVPQHLLIAGREPTLLPDLPDLVRRLRRGGVQAVGVASNGRRLALPNYAQALTDAGLSYAKVRMAGADAATHDGYTQAAGSFAQTCAGLAQLHRRGVPVVIDVVVHGGNVAQLAGVAQVAKERGAVGVAATIALAELPLWRLRAMTSALAEVAL